MTAEEFEDRIVSWARRKPEIEALVQIGSRVQQNAVVDEWSDWDYQLILRKPARFYHEGWPKEIAPCWQVHFERTPRQATKLSAVFESGWEAEFVLLPVWQMKIVFWAMRRPRAMSWFPPALIQGISNVRMVAGAGYRVILGGPAWERRYCALQVAWPDTEFTADDFRHHVAAFWRHAVWVGKKVMRGELRAAQRWHHVALCEHTYALLMEEARIAGRNPRPEARQAELWLAARRLEQTSVGTAPTPDQMAKALLAQVTLFQEASRSIAVHHGFELADHGPLETWIRDGLARATDRTSSIRGWRTK
ncbi:MAG TPA: aminoglycoside 6-adenylyltransferase [Lacunisphaera sp.]|nr:aminoglycoside 6-adenylyltransferase [Lacunisphaera sp.]